MNTPLKEGTMPSVWLVRGVLAVATMLALLAGIPEGYTPSVFVVVVVAAGLIVAHVAATLLAYGPRSLAVDPALAVLWGMRAAMTWTAALGVWVVARAYSGHGSPELFWLAGLVAAAVGAVVGAVAAPLRAKESRG